MSTIKKLLGTQSFLALNKHLIKTLGIMQTAVLQHLIDLSENVFNGDEFFQQSSRIESELNIETKTLRNIINKLIECKLISRTLKGVPAKYYYTIQTEEIVKLFENIEFINLIKKQEKEKGPKILQTSVEESSRLEIAFSPDIQDNNFKENKNKNKDTLRVKNQLEVLPGIESTITNKKLDSLINWNELVNLWNPKEDVDILKRCRTKYWDKLTNEIQLNIIKMIISFGSDIEFIRNEWIITIFKEKKMNRTSLNELIAKNKLKKLGSNKPNDIRSNVSTTFGNPDQIIKF